MPRAGSPPRHRRAHWGMRHRRRTEAVRSDPLCALGPPGPGGYQCPRQADSGTSGTTVGWGTIRDMKLEVATLPASTGLATGPVSRGRPAPVEATATNRPEVLAAVDIGTNS